MAAGTRIADREGLDGLSMRKVAGALDVGAMSLYTYVPGRTELLDLMVDRAFAERAASGVAYDDYWTSMSSFWTDHLDPERSRFPSGPDLSTMNWSRPLAPAHRPEDSVERTVVVAITEGLHARPAALFAQKAGAQPVSVTIAKTAGGDPVDAVDAASILGIMTLGAAAGDEVVLRTEADGDEATTALDSLVDFLSQEAVA